MKVKINYYDQFKCMANNCPYTCCQQWAVGIDDTTYERWKNIKLEEIGLPVTPQATTLCDCLEKEGEGYIIQLEEDKRCPFLDERQLCKLVVEKGETYISDICKRYPRHINTFENREEYSLDFGCPAVIDLLYAQTEGVNYVVEEQETYEASLLEQVRALILTHLEDENDTLVERLLITYYCLLDLLEQEQMTKEQVDTYKDAEYLSALVEEIRKVDIEDADAFWERNILFLDMAQIYRKGESYAAHLDEICLWAERLEEYYSDQDILAKQQQFEVMYSAYKPLLKNYLIAELWASCLRQDMDLEEMVMMFEWVVLEYACIKHAVFLSWLSEEEKPLTYEKVREYIMIISRIAGYDKDEVEGCMEHSFESTILEWGHLALLVGTSTI